MRHDLFFFFFLSPLVHFTRLLSSGKIFYFILFYFDTIIHTHACTWEVASVLSPFVTTCNTFVKCSHRFIG